MAAISLVWRPCNLRSSENRYRIFTIDSITTCRLVENVAFTSNRRKDSLCLFFTCITYIIPFLLLNGSRNCYFMLYAVVGIITILTLHYICAILRWNATIYAVIKSEAISLMYEQRNLLFWYKCHGCSYHC